MQKRKNSQLINMKFSQFWGVRLRGKNSHFAEFHEICFHSFYVLLLPFRPASRPETHQIYMNETEKE